MASGEQDLFLVYDSLPTLPKGPRGGAAILSELGPAVSCTKGKPAKLVEGDGSLENKVSSSEAKGSTSESKGRGVSTCCGSETQEEG